MTHQDQMQDDQATDNVRPLPKKVIGVKDDDVFFSDNFKMSMKKNFQSGARAAAAISPVLIVVVTISLMASLVRRSLTA